MKKLPLEIGQELILKPLNQNVPHRTKTQVIGAKHGEFIIIEKPIIKVTDRLVFASEAFICWTLQEGNIYRFESIIKKYLEEDLCLLEYPSSFQVESLRKNIRIKVNLETQFKVGFKNAIFKGTILDISEGGCRLEADSIIIVGKNERIVMSFVLPDDRRINEIEGITRNVLYDRLRNKTEIGVQFKGSESELVKIYSFCQFCQYFKV